IVAVAAEKNSTLVLPFPVELLRFLERAAQQTPPAPATPRQAPRRASRSVPESVPDSMPESVRESVQEQLPSGDPRTDSDPEGSISSHGQIRRAAPPVTPS
ncbi:slipin family protein, partial [Streptomyces griseoloalbus]